MKVHPIKGGGFSVRLRCGAGGHHSFRIATETEREALARAKLMAELSHLLVAAGKGDEAVAFVRSLGEATNDADARDVAAFARETADTKEPKGKASERQSPTFAEFGRSWTNGELHKLYPDQVPLKDTAKDDNSRLERYVYPLIGHLRLDAIKLDDLEDVMRKIPASAARSRRHIAGTVSRLFRMAAYPCRWIERSPLPSGFLPRANSRKAMAYLYPREDARLMACTLVPYEYRLLWGVLTREGMRVSEALALTWDCVDLTHGMLRLDSNKTDDPRSWALDPGVARALAIHQQHFASGADGSDPVFIQRSRFGIAEALREHLKQAGIDRAELFVTNAHRQRIRAHDLRGTFVTLSLANGKPERWVMARTGHTTSAMVSRYHRTAMSFSELNLGELTPLDVAIPEIAALRGQPTARGEVCSDMCNTASKLLKTQASPTGFESRAGDADVENPAGNPEADSVGPQRGALLHSPSSENVQQTGPADPVEAALAEALRGATAAGQWQVVAQLASELQARREARQAPEVVSLELARQKRNGGHK